MPASGSPSGALRPPAPLLEREGDLAALRALVEVARAGNGGFAVIEGSAGIGKTRLLAEARGIAAGMGVRVLSARGGELEREFAFGSALKHATIQSPAWRAAPSGASARTAKSCEPSGPTGHGLV